MKEADEGMEREEERGLSRIAQVRRAVAWVTTGTALFLGAMYWFAGDVTPWGEYFTIWPSFCWLIGLGPMALAGLSLRTWRASLVMLGAIALLILTTVEWTSLLRERGGEKPAGGLRVVSWNILSLYGETQPRLLERLESVQADLIFMQETPLDPTLFAPEKLSGEWRDFHWHDAGDCGLLSRYPFETLPVDQAGWGTAPQAARVMLPEGRGVLVIHVHLMLPVLVLNPLKEGAWPRLLDGNRWRVEQYPLLVKKLAQLRAAYPEDEVILIGDFNTPGGARSMRPLEEAGLRDVWGEAGAGWYATFPQHRPVTRIDQCWVSAGIGVRGAWVEDGAPSDHRMLVVDLEMGVKE